MHIADIHVVHPLWQKRESSGNNSNLASNFPAIHKSSTFSVSKVWFSFFQTRIPHEIHLTKKKHPTKDTLPQFRRCPRTSSQEQTASSPPTSLTNSSMPATTSLALSGLPPKVKPSLRGQQLNIYFKNAEVILNILDLIFALGSH